MKFIISSFVFCLLFTCSLQAQKLKTKSDSISYAVGLDLAKKLRESGFDDVNQSIMIKALEASLDEKETLFDPITATSLMVMEKRIRAEKVVERRKSEGQLFLDNQAKRPEVKALSNGILYEVLKEGFGPKPEKGGDVKIHYEGKLTDGTVFDSSYERGNPSTFNLKRLIKGWQVALPEMPAGSKWRIYLPYDMAYGSRGAGQQIKPYSTLIFDIEVFEL